MKSTLKKFAFALSLAMLAITTAQAARPTGTARSSSTLIQGGSHSSSVWKTPTANAYKVFVQVLNGTATNASYRIYPQGKLPTSSTCSSTDASYPCYQIFINQALNKNKWVQLTLNNDSGTKWNFSTAGFVAVYANTSKATEQISVAQIVFQPSVTTLTIGQTYQGGIIFYLDGAKQHGLIAAPKDQSSGLQWYNSVYLNTNAYLTALETGISNTSAIVSSQGTGFYAASLCDNLVIDTYSDWYLPSKDELALMYKNIGQGAAAPLTNVGIFSAHNYWSSSEYDDNFVWHQDFSNGIQNTYDKYGSYFVRAIRSF